MFELQLFDSKNNTYVPIETGEEPADLMALTHGSRRVVSTLRGTEKPRAGHGLRFKKTLPLRPRSTYRRQTLNYRAGTMIEPAQPRILAQRAVAWYERRAKAGEKNIPLFYWQHDDTFYRAFRCLMAAYPDAFKLVKLDPEQYL